MRSFLRCNETVSVGHTANTAALFANEVTILVMLLVQLLMLRMIPKLHRILGATSQHFLIKLAFRSCDRELVPRSRFRFTVDLRLWPKYSRDMSNLYISQHEPMHVL